MITLDTSGLVAVISPTDPRHREAALPAVLAHTQHLGLERHIARHKRGLSTLDP